MPEFLLRSLKKEPPSVAKKVSYLEVCNSCSWYCKNIQKILNITHYSINLKHKNLKILLKYLFCRSNFWRIMSFFLKLNMIDSQNGKIQFQLELVPIFCFTRFIWFTLRLIYLSIHECVCKGSWSSLYCFYLCENEKETVVDIGSRGTSSIKLLSRLRPQNTKQILLRQRMLKLESERLRSS